MSASRDVESAIESLRSGDLVFDHDQVDKRLVDLLGLVSSWGQPGMVLDFIHATTYETEESLNRE